MKKCENSKKFLLNPDCTYRRIPHKADCTQERHLFISTKHPLTPFVKPHEVLNLAIQNVFYVQSGFTYNLGSTKKLR